MHRSTHSPIASVFGEAMALLLTAREDQQRLSEAGLRPAILDDLQKALEAAIGSQAKWGADCAEREVERSRLPGLRSAAIRARTNLSRALQARLSAEDACLPPRLSNLRGAAAILGDITRLSLFGREHGDALARRGFEPEAITIAESAGHAYEELLLRLAHRSGVSLEIKTRAHADFNALCKLINEVRSGGKRAFASDTQRLWRYCSENHRRDNARKRRLKAEYAQSRLSQAIAPKP